MRAGGYYLTIQAANFTGTTAVRFNGIPAAFAGQDRGDGAASTGPIQVTSSAGTGNFTVTP